MNMHSALKGKYSPMLEGMIKTYAILDFRGDVPAVIVDNFWYFVYDEHFEKITLYRRGKDPVVLPLLH
jgi:hypothetical protein